jgi:hypothetical protein
MINRLDVELQQQFPGFLTGGNVSIKFCPLEVEARERVMTERDGFVLYEITSYERQVIAASNMKSAHFTKKDFVKLRNMMAVDPVLARGMLEHPCIRNDNGRAVEIGKAMGSMYNIGYIISSVRSYGVCSVLVVNEYLINWSFCLVDIEDREAIMYSGSDSDFNIFHSLSKHIVVLARGCNNEVKTIKNYFPNDEASYIHLKNGCFRGFVSVSPSWCKGNKNKNFVEPSLAVKDVLKSLIRYHPDLATYKFRDV